MIATDFDSDYVFPILIKIYSVLADIRLQVPFILAVELCLIRGH